jgi:AcrR family transcriptional regulator
MISRTDQRQAATERLAAHLLATGLAQTSLRQLAAAAGVSDRMLLYYFADKEDAMAAALGRVAEQLMLGLDMAIPATVRLSAADLFARMAALMADEAMKPAMRLWIEIVAAAYRDEPPYSDAAGRIGAGFLDWLALRLDTDETRRRAEAAMILAMVDGLAILDVFVPRDARVAAEGAMMQRLMAGDAQSR